ncbi:hypothetical protein ACOI1H_23630, partial [Loktanella sp. DJP18]|uniref:hypothetical protein n=1 Tax=Loktanella sp. DJP18 TaxID=3409788 RepID=UPI003BB793C5
MFGRAEPQLPPKQAPFFDFLGSRHIVLKIPGQPHPDDLPDSDVIIATWWETAEWVAALPSIKGRKFYLLQD